ncbi:MAG: KEOPS complex subunit Pcc1 [Candidatus Thermoplasmatota archaeon]|nr:KEOPS complex subunit Pcc1 [Candidatus Thermoplasmatota archaeon]MDI6855396.1 KEOPS complex subunit Pcc1 [Candidatus Thermoplasmatota archaeon]MDI6887611.1 KEOPS complex subunit Pcc1 [Candidatus Thermoplasmatota archaeon]
MKIANFVLELDNNKAQILRQALIPEGRREIPRTKIEIKAEKNKFLVRIEAHDTSALRAAINSYLRWIECALRIIEYSKS